MEYLHTHTYIYIYIIIVITIRNIMSINVFSVCKSLAIGMDPARAPFAAKDALQFQMGAHVDVGLCCACRSIWLGVFLACSV